jgi:F-type H+-transporting ATPase subunit b
MNRLLVATLAGALLLAPVSTVFAQEHDGGHEAEHGEDHGASLGDRIRSVVGTTDFKGALVNFCLLLALFIYMGRKPVTQFFESRKAQIENDLAEAARLKAEAEAIHAEHTERLEKLDEELAQIRADMASAGKKERDRIISEAETKTARMRKDAEFLIEQQMKQLREELTVAAVNAAIAAAREVLTKETTAADQQRLADGYLERLKSRIADGIDGQGRV